MSATPGTATTGATVTRRRPIRINPWVIVVITVVVMLGGVTFLLPTLSGGAVESFAVPGFEVVPTLAMVLLGVAVATRQRANPIGWIFLTAGLLFAAQMLASRYARWSVLLDDGPDLLANLGFWFEGWIWIPAMALVSTVLFLLFPTGSVPSRRWGWVLATAAIAVADAAPAFVDAGGHTAGLPAT